MTRLIPADIDQRDRVRWGAIHLLSLAAMVPLLLWINRGQWVSGDEWEVITTRGLGANPQRLSIFAPRCRKIDLGSQATYSRRSCAVFTVGRARRYPRAATRRSGDLLKRFRRY